MSTAVILLVLAAALLHATWNIIVKGGSNKFFEAAINTLGGGLGALFILPFVPAPDKASWLLLGLSCVLHLAYSVGMAAVYRVADLTLGYPVMRGAAPLLTAFALMLFGRHLPLAGWLGVILLCSGIFMLAAGERLGHKGAMKGVLYSLRVSFFIMGYTLADGFGARAAGDSLSYTCWIFILNIFPLNVYIMARHGREYLHYLRHRGAIGICGGLCGLGSYGIAIWAMTVAPIALVAALRETSVIFGMIMAVIFLGERLTLARVIAIILVMGGAMIARLG